jgi:hypothetical protein
MRRSCPASPGTPQHRRRRLAGVQAIVQAYSVRVEAPVRFGGPSRSATPRSFWQADNAQPELAATISGCRPRCGVPSRRAATLRASGHIDMRAQAEAPSARRADTPTLVALADVSAAGWRNCDARGVWRTATRKNWFQIAFRPGQNCQRPEAPADSAWDPGTASGPQVGDSLRFRSFKTAVHGAVGWQLAAEASWPGQS